MPYASGIVPGGQQLQQLENITRRAFVPKLIYQLANSTPFLYTLVEKAKLVSGGLAPITVPVQGANLTAGQWITFDGSFAPPQILTGIYNAEFNLKSFLVPVPIYGQELHIQDEYAVIDVVEARMNDVYNTLRTNLNQALFFNYQNLNQLLGLPAAVDNGTNLATYAGINRVQNTWWQAYVVNNSTQQTTTRNLVMQYIAGLTKYSGGATPNLGLCSFGTWLALAQDFASQERYMRSMDERMVGTYTGGFEAIMVSGVPIYPDPTCPDGTLYLLNTDHIYMAIDKNAAFAVLPFQSALPNYQYAYIGGVLLNSELVCDKPRSQGVITNLSYVSV